LPNTVRTSLLAAGIASSLLYVFMVVFTAMQSPGYSSFTQTISELSAVDAPTRRLWVPLGAIYTLSSSSALAGAWSRPRVADAQSFGPAR